jgi:hypothetical protein
MREPRVVIRPEHGELRTLASDDPLAERLQNAADRLISAAQRGSEV